MEERRTTPTIPPRDTRLGHEGCQAQWAEYITKQYAGRLEPSCVSTRQLIRQSISSPSLQCKSSPSLLRRLHLNPNPAIARYITAPPQRSYHRRQREALPASRAQPTRPIAISPIFARQDLLSSFIFLCTFCIW
jgi:hypothetical protein